MYIVNPSFCIETKFDGLEMIKEIERFGRTCYKSEDLITEDSAVKFVKMIINRGHHSVLEHKSISVRVICDRGVTHEIVRHRIAAYSQESTRYCNYSKDKFGSEVTFIDPKPHMGEDEYMVWLSAMESAEQHYFALLKAGAKPQMARSVLPNSLKTEIIMTYNLRQWCHFFTLRTSSKSHPQMYSLARPMLAEFRKRIPVVFDDVGTLDNEEEKNVEK